MDWDMDFTVRSHHKTKLIKQYKNYPKIHGQTRGGGGRTIPLNTPLVRPLGRINGDLSEN